MKKVNLFVIQIPKYVQYECPYCEEDVEVDYEEFCDFTGEPPDWTYSKIECPYCNSSLEIDSYEWD